MAKIQLAVLRYVLDPVRDEPRNVGVMAWHEGGVSARFLGEDERGALDLRHVSRAIIADRQTYADWVRFLRECVNTGEIESPAQRRRVRISDPDFLNSLATVTQGNYSLRLGAEAYVGSEQRVDAVVAQAYQRLVDETATSTGSGFALTQDDLGEQTTSHRMLAHDAYLTLRRNRLEEERDFVRHYRVFGETAKGSAVPAVFDFGVVPRSGELFGSGRTLLIDALSMNVPETEAAEVIDRARAMASKAVEIRKKNDGTEVRALVSNGSSASTELGRYALNVLHDEGELSTVTLPEMLQLVIGLRRDTP